MRKSEVEELPQRHDGQPAGPVARGFTQFALVFDELTKTLGEEFSTAELMSAAQQLIALSKQEYVVEVVKAAGDRPNYYSHAVDFAINNKQSQIAVFEQISVNTVDNDGFTAESMANYRRMVLSMDDMIWEF